MSYFVYIDILEPCGETLAVCKVDVKVLVVGYYCSRGLFTLSMRMRRNVLKMAHITLRNYEHGPWILWT